MYHKPYIYRKPQVAKQAIALKADDVWAAAWQAFVINGKQYIKSFDCSVDPKATGQKTNRMIAEDLLADITQLTPESIEQGQTIRRYFKGLTFKLIEGEQLSPFMQSAFEVASKEEITTKYDLAVIISLPATYEKATQRDNIDRRIQWARGGTLGVVGEKVETEIEVVKRLWSEKWNTWFVTGITDDDKVSFFSYNREIQIGSRVKIKGTVKSHRETTTQLNRVKVIS